MTSIRVPAGPDAIERDLDRIRAEMDHTLEELEERLAPSEVKAQLESKLARVARNVATHAPRPSRIAAIGAALMVLGVLRRSRLLWPFGLGAITGAAAMLALLAKSKPR